MNEWKTLDLKNPPDLTKEYVIQKYENGEWSDFNGAMLNALMALINYGFHFGTFSGVGMRYRENTKRTIEDVAGLYADEEAKDMTKYVKSQIEIENLKNQAFYSFEAGFRAGRSDKYSDVVL